jgi:hypothetical protein
MNKHIFTLIRRSGEITRTIEEITKDEAKSKVSLGVGSGLDLNHCIYLGAKYCKKTKDFPADVKYYRICHPEEHDMQGRITVEFYK